MTYGSYGNMSRINPSALNGLVQNGQVCLTLPQLIKQGLQRTCPQGKHWISRADVGCISEKHIGQGRSGLWGLPTSTCRLK